MEKKSLWCSANFTVIPVNLSQVQTVCVCVPVCAGVPVCERLSVCLCVCVFLLPGVFLRHSSTFKHPRSTETQYKKNKLVRRPELSSNSLLVKVLIVRSF